MRCVICHRRLKYLLVCAIGTVLTILLVRFKSDDYELLERRVKLELRHDSYYLARLDGEDTPLIFNRTGQGDERSSHIKEASPTHESQSGGYILTRSYGGQMTRAIKNMMIQQCCGATIDTSLKIVEPFSSRSNLYNSPKFWTIAGKGKASNAARFSDFYDLDCYNRRSLEDNMLQLVTWENFLRDAPRSAVVLSVSSLHDCENGMDAPKLQLTSGCSWSNDFKKFVTALSTKYKFHVINKVCVKCEAYPVALRELQTMIYGQSNISRLTVLVDAWLSKDIYKWLQVPKLCNVNEDPSSLARLRTSEVIASHTRYYVDKILGGRRTIAVMIRTEMILEKQLFGRTNGSLSSCIYTALRIHDELKTLSTNTSTFLTLDVGRFGSTVMQDPSKVERLKLHKEDSVEFFSNLAIEHLYNGKYTQGTWEETFIEASGGITDTGYISTLQRNIATGAECLILVGGGYYQQVAAYQYIEKHPDPSSRCLHTVCTYNFKTS